MWRRALWLLGLGVSCWGLAASAHGALVQVYEFQGQPGNGNEPQTSLVYSDGYFYGTTVTGGANDFGAVYRVRPNGADFQLIHSFASSGPDAAAGPQGSIVLANNAIYGIVNGGGPAAAGRLYKVGIDGTGFQYLHTFAGGIAGDGADPFGGLIVDQGVLYGTTSRGGNAFNRGAIFKLNLDGTGYQQIKDLDFANTGGSPLGSLLKLGNTLYGTTSLGLNVSTNGTIFKVNVDGTGFSLLHQFAGGPADGRSAIAGLISDGTRLFGSTNSGGAHNGGTIFSLLPDGSDYQVLHSFEPLNATGPEAELTLIGSTLYGATRGGGSSGLGSVFRLETDGSDFTTLGDLLDAEALSPETTLWLLDNRLYGTSRYSFEGSGAIYALDLPRPKLIGDANADCTVGAADYAIWAAQFGQTGTGLSADFDENGSVGAGDYTLWAANFGNTCPPDAAASVPEPGSLALGCLGMLGLVWLGRRRV